MSGSFGKDVRWTVLGNAVPPLSALAIAPILAHGLGVAGRGEVAAATAPYLLAISGATIGLPEAVTYFVSKRPDLVTRTTKIALAVSAASSLATVVLILPYAQLASGGILFNATLLASFAVPPMLLVGVLRGVAGGLQRWRSVALERASGALFRLVLVVVLWLADSLSVTTASVAVAAAPILGCWAYLKVRGDTEPKDSPAGSVGLRDIVGYGSRIWVGSIAGVLLLRVDQIFLALLSDSYQLGLYAVAVNVAEVPLFLNNAVREVIFAAESKERDREQLASAARMSLVLSALVGALVCGTAPFWMTFVFGQEFDSALLPLLVLALAVVSGTPGSIAGSGLSARGRPELRSYSLIIACIVNVLLLALTASWLGALGAALATLVAYQFSSGLNVVFISRIDRFTISEFYTVRRSDLVQIAKFRRWTGSSGRATRNQDVGERQR